MAITENQRATILELLAAGASLRQACREADVEHPTDVLRLRDRDDAFALQYARAREDGYLERADSLLSVARDPSIPAADKRIITDTMKWELSKMLPKVYGDKLDLNHSGSIRTGAAGMTDEELQAIAAQARKAE
jgi:hypothetical protein